MKDYILFLEELLQVKLNDHIYKDMGTQMGACDLKNKILYINPKCDSASLLFTIAHELRHLYQYTYQLDKYKHEFDNYENGNMYQKCEIDANTFARFIFRNMFLFEPKINVPYDDNLISDIKNRFTKLFKNFDINEICEELKIPNVRKML